MRTAKEVWREIEKLEISREHSEGDIIEALRSYAEEVKEECVKEAAKHNFAIAEIIRVTIKIP